MAKRPIFIPDLTAPNLFHEKIVEFEWSSGFADVQKKKNIKALHQAATRMGLSNILEISTKSEEEVGRRLSAFNLKCEIGGKKFPLESVYQGSKVFEKGGPFKEIFDYEPREAKKFIRELNCGNITNYRLEGVNYPLSPANAFYDWIYIRSLADHADWIERKMKFTAFTDIEFNPQKQINCQARAFAGYLSLLRKGELSKVSKEFDYFYSMLSAI